MVIDVLVWAGVIGLAAVVAAAYLSGRTGVALGALFAGASFSGVTAPLGDVNVRVEQPALALLAALIIWRQPGAMLRFGRANLPLLVVATLYVGPQVLSSAFLAPQPAESLKIAGWLVLSMVGMGVASVLVFSSGSDLRLPRWIMWAAAIQVAVGLGAVVSQAFFATTWGVHANDVVLGKAQGLSWEANILAINLAMALAFAIAPPVSDRMRHAARFAALVWLSIGLGLAYSRGGLIAFAVAAMVVMLGLAWVGRRRLMAAARARVVPVAALSALAIATALVTIQVQATLGQAGIGWTPGTVLQDEPETPDGTVVPPPSEATATSEPSATSGPTSEESEAPRETSTPEVRFVGIGDTLAIRLTNMRIALAEVASSPLIGLGTDSYRQRHIEPSCACPAHVANLTVATLYEGGVLALGGLAAILWIVLRATWKLRLWAYLAALVALIVGYQVTDAFRFASNWILIGAVVGMWTAVRLRRRDDPRPW